MNDFDYIEKNLEDIVEKDEEYIFDKEWQINSYGNELFKAFKKTEIHRFRTPMHFFSIHLREHENHTILKSLLRNKETMTSKTYSVIIKAAQSGSVLPITHWCPNDISPWQNHNGLLDVFYGGRKYKKEFQETYNLPVESSTKSALGLGFDELESARAFAEHWKSRLVDDHASELEKTHELFLKIKHIQSSTT